MSDRFIPYGHQQIDEGDIAAVGEVLRSEWLTQGPAVEQFEKAFASYVGSRYAVAVNSGTAALHCAYWALGISSGDEVLVPTNTFCATANAAVFLQAKPVFVDICPETFNMQENLLEAAITPRTKAIVPVHFAGQPCAMDKIQAIARKHRLAVVEDACHALGATWQGRHAGVLGNVACFSFHPVKHITTGEGGMVTTDDVVLYEKMKQFRSHGITRDRKTMRDDDGPWFYEMQQIGYNYRMSDMQAALGQSQLRHIDLWVQQRREIAAYYRTLLKNVENVLVPKDSEGHAYHLFVVRVPAGQRRLAFERLRQMGIGVQVHYIPLYRLPFYRVEENKRHFWPVSETYYQACISLPMFPALTREQIEYVCFCLKESLQA